jgi:hypothetical protein
MALVIVDGDNLLHGVRGSRDGTGETWLLARLRAWRPPDLELVLVLDGYPEPGGGFRRPFGAGFEVRHSGSVDGDTAILRLLRERPPGHRDQALVVTDDRLLADRVRQAGAHWRKVAWLRGQLAPAGRPSGSTRAPAQTPQVGLGSGRGPRATAAGSQDPEHRPWTPGRGATRKRGNPWRRPR